LLYCKLQSEGVFEPVETKWKPAAKAFKLIQPRLTDAHTTRDYTKFTFEPYGFIGYIYVRYI